MIKQGSKRNTKMPLQSKEKRQTLNKKRETLKEEGREREREQTKSKSQQSIE